MSQSSRVQTVRYGKHASTFSFLDTPGALKNIYVGEEERLTEGVGFVEVERLYATPEGEPLASARGKESVELSGFSMPINALSDGSPGVGSAETSSGFDTAVHELLEMLFGGVLEGSGAGTDGGSGTTLTLDAGFNDPVVGSAMQIRRSGDSFYLAREITALNTGVDYDIDVQLLNDDGTAASPPVSTTTSFGARTYYADQDVVNRTHLYFDVERDTGRNIYFGCYPTGAKIKYEHGKQLMLEIAGLRCTDRDDGSADANPGYTAPTQGNEIIGAPVYVTIDSTLFVAYDIEIDLGLQTSDRRNDASGTGINGGVITKIQPVVTMKLIEGLGTGPSEISHSQINTFRGSTPDAIPTRDIGIQMGGATVQNPAAYFRMPAASCKWERQTENGIDIVQVTAMATERSDHATIPGVARLHIF